MEHQKGTCFFKNEVTYKDCLECEECSKEYIDKMHKIKREKKT